MSKAATKFSAKIEPGEVYFSYTDEQGNVLDCEMVPISSNQHHQLSHRMVWCDTLATKYGHRLEELEHKGNLRFGKIW